MDFRAMVLLAFLLALGAGDKTIAARLDMTAENVRIWRHKFEAMEKMGTLSDLELIDRNSILTGAVTDGPA
jgi:DNA-binding NarL/FixJ family response regulator